MSNPFAADATAVRGAITPLITPFHDDGELDLDAVRSLVEWQLQHGTHGISVGGSTGEPTSQTVDERIEVMRAAAAAIGDQVPFLTPLPSSTTHSSPATTNAPARCTTTCTRWPRPRLPRPTPCPSNGS